MATSHTYTTRSGQPFTQSVRDDAFEPLLRRRFFYTEAFEIYRTCRDSKLNGANKGLYDYGPPGCALQANIVELWRRHFVLEENMLEVDCTMLTPEDVFKTSGHVDKFADYMCKDSKTGDYIRADHLIEGVLESRLESDKLARGQSAQQNGDAKKDPKKAKTKVKDAKATKLDDSAVAEYEDILAQIDNFDGDKLAELIQRLDIKNPGTNNDVLPPVPFNLMFKTQIGPSSASPGYLRPETAQGQFVNFKKLLEYNAGAMPFASASIGKSFRNEISPRSGLLRVREFLMAEVEHFVDPEGGKKHARFSEVEQEELVLLDRHTQLSGRTDTRRMTIGEAVKNKVVDNQTLGYFLVRIKYFLEKIGADPKKTRFRQHMDNEMAHYASDCWDAELLTTYGWIECVGCADRSAYDLTVHAKRTGEALVVREQLATPLKIEEWQCELNKKKLGPAFRKDAGLVEKAVEALPQSERASLAKELKSNGKVAIQVDGLAGGKAELPSDLLQIEWKTRIEHTREYTPNVIEPSFGIGRILYSVLEHVYWQREGTEEPAAAGKEKKTGDVERYVLSLPPAVAPTKVLIVPLSNTEELKPITRQVTHRLRMLGIASRVDESSVSIGKRYSRNDELGTPLGITVDFDSLKDQSVTLRERDTTKQVRASQDDILAAVKALVDGHETWEDVSKRLPEFTGQNVEK